MLIVNGMLFSVTNICYNKKVYGGAVCRRAEKYRICECVKVQEC